MKKYLPIIIFFLAILILTPKAFAQSSANVEIHNNINSTSSTNSNIESHTDIKVETDGEVTRYSSDEPNQKIEVKSENGESSIKVDGKEIENNDSEEISKMPTPTPFEKLTPSPTPQSEIEKFIKEKLSFIEKIFSFLGSFGK